MKSPDLQTAGNKAGSASLFPAPLPQTWSPSCLNSVGAAQSDQMQERASWADMKLVERQEAQRPLQPLPLEEDRAQKAEESSFRKDRISYRRGRSPSPPPPLLGP